MHNNKINGKSYLDLRLLCIGIHYLKQYEGLHSANSMIIVYLIISIYNSVVLFVLWIFWKEIHEESTGVSSLKHFYVLVLKIFKTFLS